MKGQDSEGDMHEQIDRICKQLEELLLSFPLPADWDGQEGSFKRAFHNWAEPQLLNQGLELVTGGLGRGPFGTAAFGTDFWPDAAVFDKYSGLKISIQYKIAHPNKLKDGKPDTGNRAQALKEVIGQALIDTMGWDQPPPSLFTTMPQALRFNAAIAFLLDMAGPRPPRRDPHYFHRDDQLVKKLLKQANVWLVVRVESPELWMKIKERRETRPS